MKKYMSIQVNNKNIRPKDITLFLQKHQQSIPFCFNDFTLICNRKSSNTEKNGSVNLTELINSAVSDIEDKLNHTFKYNSVLLTAELKNLDLIKLNLLQQLYDRVYLTAKQSKTDFRPRYFEDIKISELPAYAAITDLHRITELYQEIITADSDESIKTAAQKLLKIGNKIHEKICINSSTEWIKRTADQTLRIIIGFTTPIIAYGCTGIACGLIGAMVNGTIMGSADVIPEISTSLLAGYAATGIMMNLPTNLRRIYQRGTAVFSWQQIGSDAKTDITKGLEKIQNSFSLDSSKTAKKMLKKEIKTALKTHGFYVSANDVMDAGMDIAKGCAKRIAF